MKMYEILINIWIAIGVITFFTLLIISAPYGRHLRAGWGYSLPKKVGWILMESPALYLMWIYYFWYNGFQNIVLIFFLAIWSIHYFNRSIVWPLRIKKDGSMPLLVALMAFVFNAINTFFHGYWFFLMDKQYDTSWFFEPVFIIGFLRINPSSKTVEGNNSGKIFIKTSHFWISSIIGDVCFIII